MVTSGANLNKVLMEVRLANRPIIKQGQAKVEINGVNHKEVQMLNGVNNLALRVVKTLKVIPEQVNWDLKAKLVEILSRNNIPLNN